MYNELIEKSISVTPGYFLFFPSEYELCIKNSYLSASLFKLKDKNKTSWIKEFFERLNYGQVLKDIIHFVPDQYKKTVMNIIVTGLQKGYFTESLHDKHILPYWMTNNMYGKEKFLKESIQNTNMALIGLGVLGAKIASKLLRYEFNNLKLIDCGTLSNLHIENCHEYINQRIGQNKVYAYEQFYKSKKGLCNTQFIDVQKFQSEKLEAELKDCNFVTVAVDEYDPLLYSLINSLAIKYKFRWTLLFVDRWDLYIGPTFIPEQTGCLQCLEDIYVNKLDSLSPKLYKSVEELKNGYPNIQFNPDHALIVSGFFLADLPNIIGEMPRMIEPENSLTLGKQLKIDTRNFDAKILSTIKNPNCKCSKIE
ncbi:MULTISPECIES: ThiF family adenylyltransferase [Bacillus cereus group]|uniref:THIF-type NAD/FAD binding fold domain-containing protein n=2 Tax=Bacillus cereus group TaxID=86661 RepID=A0A2B9E183_BACCE|nr:MULTISPECIES: ThiF family adenylyltransferase [Bacillus cereus group]EJR33355.1 hypothetical protein III_04911 [Bacillus mycoides]PGM93607.1 hypothetical protein CN958_12480 [Bacillus cereus]